MKKKLVAFGLGALVVFLSLEIVLRATSALFEHEQTKLNFKKPGETDKKTINIFSIGESTTAVAADITNNLLIPTTAYPIFLEKYLNDQIPEYNFKVFNFGFMGGGSDKVVSILSEKIKYIKPDIVVSMMGMKDEAGVRSAQEQAFGRLSLYLQLLAENSKVLKWLVVLKTEYENRTKSIYSSRSRSGDEGFLGSQLSFINKVRTNAAIPFGYEHMDNFEDSNFDRFFRHYFLASYYLNIGEFNSAQDILNFLKKYHQVGYFGLYNIYVKMGKFELAEKIMLEYLQKRPDNPYVYANLIKLYLSLHQFDKIEKLVSEISMVKESVLDFSSIDIQLGRYYFILKNFKKAEQIFKKYDLKYSSKNLNMKVIKFGKKTRRLRVDTYIRTDYLVDSKQMKGLFTMVGASEYWLAMGNVLLTTKRYAEAENYLKLYIGSRRSGGGGEGQILLQNLYREIGKTSSEELLLKKRLSNYSLLADYYVYINYLVSEERQSEINDIFKMIEVNFPQTIYNYRRMHSLCKDKGSHLIVMQYPTFNLEIIKRFLPFDDVFFLSNERIFDDDSKSAYIFEPRHPYSYNHYTVKGAQVLAQNLAGFIKAQIRNGKMVF